MCPTYMYIGMPLCSWCTTAEHCSSSHTTASPTSTLYNIKCKWWKANKLSNKWTGNNRKNVARLVYCFELAQTVAARHNPKWSRAKNTKATCHTKYIRFRFWHISYSIRFDFDTVAVVATAAVQPSLLSSIVDVAIAKCQCCCLDKATEFILTLVYYIYSGDNILQCTKAFLQPSLRTRSYIELLRQFNKLDFPIGKRTTRKRRKKKRYILHLFIELTLLHILNHW